MKGRGKLPCSTIHLKFCVKHNAKSWYHLISNCLGCWGWTRKQAMENTLNKRYSKHVAEMIVMQRLAIRDSEIVSSLPPFKRNLKFHPFEHKTLCLTVTIQYITTSICRSKTEGCVLLGFHKHCLSQWEENQGTLNTSKKQSYIRHCIYRNNSYRLPVLNLDI